MNIIYNSGFDNSEIIKYLDFNSKIILGKVLNKSLTKFYNFLNYKNQKLYNLFYESEYWSGDYDNVIKEITEAFRNNYVEYETEEDEIEDDETEDDEIEDDDDKEIYYDLDELMQRTVTVIYTRKTIESIEDNNIIREYNKDETIFDIYNDLDIDLQNQIDNDVIKYYNYVFNKKMNLDLFCYRCGEFGHYESSNKCIFYNNKFEKFNIREEVQYKLQSLVYDVDKKINDELKEQIKRESTCKKCNVYYFSSKCCDKLCGNCCDKIECNKHKKNKKK